MGNPGRFFLLCLLRSYLQSITSPAHQSCGEDQTEIIAFCPTAHVNFGEAGYEIKRYPFPSGACRLLLPSTGCSLGSTPGAASTGPAHGTVPNTLSVWG